MSNHERRKNMEKGRKKMNWWKIIAIVLMVVFACSLLLKSFGKKLSEHQSVPENYTKTVKTGGELEEKYLAMGPHEVSFVEYAAMMSFGKYEIYYPSDMEAMSGPLPAVVFVNGTGVAGSKYQALQRHMASWGFITVATEEAHAWNGFSAEMSVRMLEMLNTLEGEYFGEQNRFYGKIATNNIGITGHSQGGYGVVNAITEEKHKENYKAAVILSSAPFSANNDFQWEADPSLIRTPTMMLSSMGTFDSTIASMESLQAVFDSIPEDVSRVLARRTEGDHGEMLYYGDGYVTAWFMYWLQNDSEAGNAFFGDHAEIASNEHWQDVRTNK